MRTRQEILKDYLILLNEEKNLGYSEEEIEQRIKDPIEQEILKSLLIGGTDSGGKEIKGELYSTEEYNGQTIFSLRAWYIWCKIIIGEDFKTGGKVYNEFVKKQFLLVERNKLSCYMAQRGAGKTFFVALFMIFKMFLIPYYDFGYCSNIPRQRKRFLKTARGLVDTNEMLLEKKDSKKVNNKEIAWGQDEMEYNQGVIEGTTVGTTPRGGHYNHSFADDPLRDDKKYTDEFILDYFQGRYKQTILRKKGRYTVVGTPQHGEDLFHVLMNNKLDKNNRPIGKVIVDKISAAGFYSKIFPGILDDNKKIVLVPEIWTYEELMIEKIRIGDIRWNREIQCKCITYKNALISASLFKSCCDEKLMMIQKGESGKKYIIFVDSATSDAPTADYCAMSVWEDNQAETKFIFRYLFHEKGYPITDPTGGVNDQAHKLFGLYNDFNKALVIVEKNNAGVALIQGASALGVPDIIEHYTHVVSTGKATAKPGKAEDVVDYIEKGLKAGVVVFPSNSEDNFTIDALERIKTEHLNFGVKKGKSGEVFEAIAGHDDIFDSSWGAFKHRGDQVDTIPFALTLPG